LFEAGEVVGIALMDHIILGGAGRFFSFRAEGLD
jgi:DNA repair protein RadC